MAEFPSLGKHCEINFCKQLDFLPFVCDGCSNIYCGDHRSKDAHACSLVNLNKPDEYTGPKGHDCSLDGCNVRELMPVICDKCKKNFCLSHRHQVDHKCTELVVKEIPNKTAELVKRILASKNPLPGKHKAKSGKSNKTAAKVALMKMKMKAVGDAGIPEVDKVFFQVQLPVEHKDQSIAMFFSKSWSVGRTVDSIASRVKLRNENNTGSEKKLRLFLHEDGCLLPAEEKLDLLIDRENGLLNGSTVVLEYVQNDCVFLESLEQYKVP